MDDIDTLVELLRLEQQPGVTDGDECALEEELLPIAPSFFLKLLEAFPPQARGGAKVIISSVDDSLHTYTVHSTA